MRMNEVDFSGGLPIDGYGPGFFRVSGTAISGPILILPSGVHEWGGYGDMALLSEQAGDMDVLFIGTGAETAHVPRTFRDPLEQAGLGVEAMASAPACRTYNVLLSEGRRVGAALLPV